jgi:ribosomal protein L31
MSQSAQQRVDSFQKRLGEPTLWFAAHAALPIALTPDLAYLLWAQFPVDVAGEPIHAPWIAVADTLLSGFCHEVGEDLYELEAEVRTHLLGRLRRSTRFGEARVAELSRFLLDLVQRDLSSNDAMVRELARSQRWASLANTEPRRAAEELASELKTTRPENGPALVRLASIIKGEDKLSAFPQVLAYADVMTHIGRRRIDQARAAWSELEQKSKLKVGSIALRAPALLRTKVRDARVKAEVTQAGRPLPLPRALSRRSFSWLHLSDLKIADSRFQHQDLLFRDLEDFGRIAGGFDFVFLAGDLTAHGGGHEFRALEGFTRELVDLLSRFGRRPLVLPVPGNHDVARRAKPSDELLNFYDYVESLGQDPGLWREQSPVGRGNFSYSFRLGEFSVAVLGLNTASAQGQSASGGIDANLRLPNGERLEDWLQRHDAALLLTHHSPRLLTPEGIRSLERLLSGPGRFWAHLFSHTHERELAGVLFDPSRITRCHGARHPPEFNIWRSLPAGGGSRNEEHPYSAGRVTFDEGALRVELWPRVWARDAQRFVPNRRVALGESISISMQPGRGAEGGVLTESRDVILTEDGEKLLSESGDPLQLETPRPAKVRRSDAVLLISRDDPPARIASLVEHLAALRLRVQPLEEPFVGFERAKKVLALVDTEGELAPELEAPLQRLVEGGLKAIQHVIPIVVGGKPRRMRDEFSQLPFVVISEPVTAEEAAKIAEAIRFVPEDPEKGKWGNAKRRSKRTIDAQVTEVNANWFRVTLKVRSTDERHPLTGDVVFHLHPTFPKSRRVVTAEDNVCTLEFECYGAFTVGAEADGGQTHLELDLSKLKGAPQPFRER